MREIAKQVLAVTVGVALCAAALAQNPSTDDSAWKAGKVIVNPAVHHDRSAPLMDLYKAYKLPPPPHFPHHPPVRATTQPPPTPPATITAAGAAVEQVTQGSRPEATQVASFDGLGDGFEGPQGKEQARNPSDNSLAVGPDDIIQIVNSRMAIFTKKGKQYQDTGRVLFGPAITNVLFAGFGGPCETLISGDAVARYDQLAKRWLIVLPIFRKAEDQPNSTYAMCYAVSTGPDPMGSYYRYQFNRPLFPDYPRPAIWSDGYYVPTSTGDTVIQKQLCAADRSKMLRGAAADEQCEIIDGVNFLNIADIDGTRRPPANMPEIVMAAGGTQLHGKLEDDGVYAWRYHVNWDNPANTTLSGPEKIDVAPYHYACTGQLSKCVPQPGTDVRLDSQGDKLMQRMAYRNFGSYQAIVVTHSIDTRAGVGVRWYEFRLTGDGTPQLYQQGTYAPDGGYRWMGSIGMDRRGDIGVGYSYGSADTFTGQRFAARLANDPKGQMTVHESVLAQGEAAQTNTLRWEDYTTLDVDPSDDCTFWYVGDYLKKGATGYSTRIGAYSLPGCTAHHKVLGIF